MSDAFTLAKLMFPDSPPVDQIMGQYPRRPLKEGALVTRFAPSPTGFMHIGNVYSSMVDERLSHSSGGKVILRIEDTDKKREIEGGIAFIIENLKAFDIEFDEGPLGENNEDVGLHGPYIQSQRKHLYHAFCKDLVEKGAAYPCFCSQEEIDEIRQKQESQSLTPGYWGEWAKCRSLPVEEAERRIKEGQPYVVRMRSGGKIGGRVKFKDIIRGDIEMEENFVDIVLLKTDGLPTYHFAHVVDDTLMGIDRVIRSDEWIASAPIHLQLFYLCGLKPIKYAHISPILKEEEGKKRKISKRKDPEAAMSFFVKEGYPAPAVMEYLLTIANSNFEDWRRQNKEASYKDFPYSLTKMSPSGALFDIAKLKSVSAEIISRMPAEAVYTHAAAWAQEFDTPLYNRLAADKDYAISIFSIDRNTPKPRKDIAKWDEIPSFLAYFYDDAFTPDTSALELDKPLQRAALQAYLPVYDPADDKDTWFAKIKDLCPALGFCPDMKEYKAAKEQYKGSISDLTSIIRVAVTGRKNTPDLCSIMALLGKERVKNRIENYIKEL